MSISIEKLQEKQTVLTRQREQMQANIFAIDGALQMVAQLITEASPVVMSPASPHTEGKGE